MYARVEPIALVFRNAQLRRLQLAWAASSLGTCAGYYAYRYLSTRKLPTTGLAVFVTAEKDTSPARLSRFRVEVETAPLSDKHRDGLLRAVQSCLIHNTLLHAPEIAVDHITILAEIPRCA